jgi:lipid A 3-O-deacylase
VARARGLRRAAAAIACASAFACAAGDARWYVQHDNDFFFDTDRWYSSGTRVARVAGGLELGLLQEIYSPDAKNPALVDRAPAARLLGVGAYHWRDASAWQTIELALGVRGPAALGRQATELAHHLATAHVVDWSLQLPSRFDAQVAFARTETLIGGLKAHYGALAGNEASFAHAGIELRCGAAPSMASQLLRYAATPPWPVEPARGWSTYTGASVRLVAHNALLARAYIPDAPAPTLRRAVGRVVAGVAWTGERATIDVSLAHETREFAEQRHPQHFGSIAVHVPF